MHRLLLLLSALLFTSPTLAQNAFISGQVRDADTRDPLPGATVSIADSNFGTITNETGHYQIALPPGQYALRFSYIGYTPWISPAQTIDDADLELNAVLQPAAIALSAMTVTPGRFAIMGDTPPSHQTLTQEEIRTVPQFGDDIFRAITHLPGVSGSDYSARFTVRGGEND